MPFTPSIHGQLEWDSKRREVGYILSWEDSSKQSDQVTSMYGTVEVISEGRASNVAFLTERISANSGAVVKHPNGKFSVEIPAAATNGHDLYFALSSGYNIDPPAGKMFVAGGVAYNTTALPLPENEDERVEYTTLPADMTLRFNYSTDMSVETLEVYYLDPYDKNSQWVSVPEAQIGQPEAGVATFTTSQLGAYALMMRGGDYPLFEAVKAMEEATKVLQQQQLVAQGGGNGTTESPTYDSGG